MISQEKETLTKGQIFLVCPRYHTVSMINHKTSPLEQDLKSQNSHRRYHTSNLLMKSGDLICILD